MIPFNIRPEIVLQPVYRPENIRHLLFANMFVVSFTRFIVVTQNTSVPVDQCEAVLVFVRTSTNGYRYNPDDNLYPQILADENFVPLKQSRLHVGNHTNI